MPSTPEAIKMTPCRCRRAAEILLEMHQLPLSTGAMELAKVTGSAPATVRSYLRLLERLGLVVRHQYQFGHRLTPAGVQLVEGVTGQAAIPEKGWGPAIAAKIEAALAGAGPADLLAGQGAARPAPTTVSRTTDAEAEEARNPMLDTVSNSAVFSAWYADYISADYSLVFPVEDPATNPSPDPVGNPKMDSASNSADVPALIAAELTEEVSTEISAEIAVEKAADPTCDSGKLLEKTPVLSTGYPQPEPQPVDKTVKFLNKVSNLTVQNTGCCEPENPESVNSDMEMEKLTLLSTGYPQPDPQTVDKPVNILNEVENFRFQSVKNAPLEENYEPRARESTTTAESLKDSFKDLKNLKTAAAEKQEEEARARANFAALQAYGVSSNARVRRLCSREDLSPESICAVADRLRGQGKLSPPLLIHCLESGERLETPTDDHRDYARYAEWAIPSTRESRERIWPAGRIPKTPEERERARYVGGDSYAVSWGTPSSPRPPSLPYERGKKGESDRHGGEDS